MRNKFLKLFNLIKSPNLKTFPEKLIFISKNDFIIFLKFANLNIIRKLKIIKKIINII